jgi:hypothetical protein
VRTWADRLTKQFKAFHHSYTFALVADNLLNHLFFSCRPKKNVVTKEILFRKTNNRKYYTKQIIATLLDLAVNLVVLDIRRDQSTTLTSHNDSQHAKEQ